MSMEGEKKTAPIGVFDSGVGGLTVVRDIRHGSCRMKILYILVTLPLRSIRK